MSALGVSLRSRPKGRLPIPMVILPFMKHGDLHAFLLMSRIGENPFVSVLLQNSFWEGMDFQRMYSDLFRVGLPKALAFDWILIAEKAVRCDVEVFHSMPVEDQLLYSIPSLFAPSLLSRLAENLAVLPYMLA